MMSPINEFIFLFAHGAGADKDSDWMRTMSELLIQSGLDVRRFNFPYMEKRALDGRRRPPDRMPKLIDAFCAHIAALPKERRIVLGGKSMGGRVASLLASDGVSPRSIDGVVCLGFPFHPPAKPQNYRGEHLISIPVRTLILQGERDSFGSRDEVSRFTLGEMVTLDLLKDGDHSFEPRKKSGLSLADNQQQAATKIIEFINSL